MARPNLLVVRWLSAYKRRQPLAEALRYELSTPELIKCAAAQCHGRGITPTAKVGLLVSLEESKDLTRNWGDVGSRFVKGVGYISPGDPTSRPTKRPKGSYARGTYDEVRGRFVYRGLVVAHNAEGRHIKEAIRVAKEFGIPFLGRLTKDGRLPRKLPKG